MRFNGASWVVVGSPGFSAGRAGSVSLSFSPDGTPYIAYSDENGKATVMRFDGALWMVAGSAAFSAGDTNFVSLSFSPDGTPYVAYVDEQQKATVMRFDGMSWVTVGGPGFLAAGNQFSQSLTFSPDGTPYLAFMDAETVENGPNAGKATVIRFDGTSWASVGNPDFSTGVGRTSTLTVNEYRHNMLPNRCGEVFEGDGPFRLSQPEDGIPAATQRRYLLPKRHDVFRRSRTEASG